ncbi:MAG: divalent-cation tolerance protein CutA [Acidobacteria bacterium]|nr:divalent-cation tolerance protein CutA [Acidobacteriota bacterium]
MIVVLITTPDRALASTLASGLVEQRLAACVQILPQMTSVYYWEGEVQRDEEHLLLIKTREDKFTEIEDFIKQNHTYDVPEIVSLRPVRVSDDYRNWLENCLNR